MSISACHITLRRIFSSIIMLLMVAAPPAIAADTVYTDPVAGIEFVHIAAGSFRMGDLAEDDETLGRTSELPIHKVTLNGFYISKTEITFDQYDLFSRETGKPLIDDNGWGRGSRPVINVSWNDALDYALWLSRKSGRKYRLPSEAQWEYAARAGTKTRFWWGNKIDATYVAVADPQQDTSMLKPLPVASYPPNPWGLYDTSGNVWEWCMDRYHDSYSGAPIDGSPWLDTELGTNEKVVRGGSFRDNEFYLASAIRTYYDEKTRKSHLGFRLVMAEATPSQTPK